jgi:membrane associated rhomboid family serine protease
MVQTCYRHPGRETAVSCSACGRPICPDCMTPTPVGMRCPECMRQRTRVVRNPTGTSDGRLGAFPATIALIAINVVVYLIEIAGGGGGLNSPSPSIIVNFALRGVNVAEGEWYRLVTGAFLHVGLAHIGFNMVALYFLGRLLEPAIGTIRFVFLYAASLFAGAFGALLLSGPDQLTLGASGAIFGIFGAAFVIARGRGFDYIARYIGILLILNLAISFGDPEISLGGHLGGLVAGLVSGIVILAAERGQLGRQRLAVELGAMTALGVLAIAGALLIA